MKKIFLGLSLVMLLFVNCSKSGSSSASCTVTNTSILGTYMLTDATYQLTPSSPVIDEFSTYVPCSKDDKITFKGNGTVVVDDGATVCTPTTAGTAKWSLNGKTLILGTDTYTVKSFDCKVLVIATSYSPGEIDTKYLTRQ